MGYYVWLRCHEFLLIIAPICCKILDQYDLIFDVGWNVHVWTRHTVDTDLQGLMTVYTATQAHMDAYTFTHKHVFIYKHNSIGCQHFFIQECIDPHAHTCLKGHMHIQSHTPTHVDRCRVHILAGLRLIQPDTHEHWAPTLIVQRVVIIFSVQGYRLHIIALDYFLIFSHQKWTLAISPGVCSNNPSPIIHGYIGHKYHSTKCVQCYTCQR